MQNPCSTRLTLNCVIGYTVKHFGEFHVYRLIWWFLFQPSTSVDPGSNPTSDRCLACGSGTQSHSDCIPVVVSPPTTSKTRHFSSYFLFIVLLTLIVLLAV